MLWGGDGGSVYCEERGGLCIVGRGGSLYCGEEMGVCVLWEEGIGVLWGGDGSVYYGEEMGVCVLWGEGVEWIYVYSQGQMYCGRTEGSLRSVHAGRKLEINVLSKKIQG